MRNSKYYSDDPPTFKAADGTIWSPKMVHEFTGVRISAAYKRVCKFNAGKLTENQALERTRKRNNDKIDTRPVKETLKAMAALEPFKMTDEQIKKHDFYFPPSF